MAVFRALRTGIDRLRRHYAALSNLPPVPEGERDARPAHLLLPYPLRLPCFSPVVVDPGQLGVGLLAADGTYFGLFPGSAQPLSSLLPSGHPDLEGLAGKTVYLARRLAVPAQVLVKFCRRGYPFAGRVGEAIQALWASHGLAPSILRSSRLPGGTDMVVMEYLDPADGWRGLSHYLQLTADAPKCVAAVRAALVRAQALRLPWPPGSPETLPSESGGVPTVHSDARVPNVLVRPSGSGEFGGFEVRFIDFDYAGVELPPGDPRAACCPPFVDRTAFPSGVVPGGRLTQVTDAATLEHSIAQGILYRDRSLA